MTVRHPSGSGFDVEKLRLNARYNALRSELGFSNAEVAERLGVHRNTAEAWSGGKVIVPRYPLAYLELLAKVREVGA